MANNKVVLADGTTLIDLTSDTAVAADVASGKTFHLANGAVAVGTAESLEVATISEALNYLDIS